MSLVADGNAFRGKILLKHADPTPSRVIRQLFMQRFDADSISDMVPSRIVLVRTAVDHSELPSVVTTLIASMSVQAKFLAESHDLLLLFYDIREAMDFVIVASSLHDPLNGGTQVVYICPYFFKQLLPEDLELEYNIFCITMDVNRNQPTANAVDDAEHVLRSIKDHFPCFSSAVFSKKAIGVPSNQLGTAAKFFVQLLDIRLIPRLMTHLREICAHATVETSDLALADCEYLFHRHPSVPEEKSLGGSSPSFYSAFTLGSTPNSDMDVLVGSRSNHFRTHSRSSSFSSFDLMLSSLSNLNTSYHPSKECRDGTIGFDRSSSIAPPSIGIISSNGNYLSGRERDYEIDFSSIESSLDTRTTCMIRNIPNKYTQQMLIDMIDESHWGQYDFIYLRMDFKNHCNVGYAFINFRDPQSIISFGHRVMNRKWPRFNSDKICHLTYARIQGKSALIEKFRNSKVMMEPPNYRPKVYYSDENRRGLEEPFPF